MLNMRRILALAMVLCLACGASFAWTNLAEVPPQTAPYSTDRPPWQPPPAPQGDLTFFTVEAEFKAACGDTTTEDFSCSVAEPGGVCSGLSPVNSSTNDGCFNACLSEGWEFLAVGIGEYAAVGTGFLGVGIPAVGPNFFTDEASWSFSPAVGCAGFKLIGDLINPVDVDCTWSSGGAALGVATIHGSLQGVFIGAVAPGIDAIDCVEQVDGSADLYGALQFGAEGGPGPPPVPAASTWGMIALISLLLGGSLYYMRRRVEA